MLRRTPLQPGRPLARGKGLARGKPLERGESTLSRGGPLRRGGGLERTRMKPTYRPAAHPPDYWEEIIIPGLLLRCAGRCEATGVDLSTGVRWSVQHRQSRSMGGTRRCDVDSWANLLVVTGDGTTGAHGWIEGHPESARIYGWSVPTQGVLRPETEPVTLFSGRRVLLAAEGPFYLPAPGEQWADRPVLT